MNVMDEIHRIFDRRGAEAYFGESVSVTEHALQTAYFAQAAGAPAALIVAALLHDVGHLIDRIPGDIAEWTEDARHERLGGLWLAERFAPAVAEPVRLHVPAKRYLLAVDPRYFDKLSPASVLTLKLQGGAMTTGEVAAFEAEVFHHDAVRLRHWDDQGKVAGLKTPGLEAYRTLIEGLALRPPIARIVSNGAR
jgi:phosphonate degradation associated HDIG domain protein